MRKLLWLVFVLMVTAGLLFGLIYRARRLKATVSVAKVEKDIRDHLPIGASRAEVAAYLDQRGIQHSYVEESQQPEYRHTEMAMIRESSRTWIIRGDIQIFFRFDEDGKLTSYSVKEIFTGP